MHPNPAFKMLYWLCLDHHKNLSVINDFSSGVSRPKRSSSVCTFVGLNLFPSGQQEILRIPMFRNPHVPFNSRVFLSDYETSIHCVPALLTSFLCLTGWMVQSLYEIQNVHLNADIIWIICNWKQWHTSSL